MTFDARHSVDKGLHHLAGRLDPVITAKLRPSLGALSWPTVLTELDKMRGKAPKTYTSTDLQSQLKVITERLGKLGFPFDNHERVVTTLGNELRIMRNRWAHHDELTTLDAWRTHDFAVRLLKHFGDGDGVAVATDLRDEAFEALAEEKGVATSVTPEGQAPAAPPSPRKKPAADDEVHPDPKVLTRGDTADTPTIGSGRDEFEAWTVVPVGEVSILDDLPKKAAKEQVRAVATEITEFEGPIHIVRLARLTAGSFGLQRLSAPRARQLTYQIRQTGLLVDGDKFVWPIDLDPGEWGEFRPNDSSTDRLFTEISPVEVANAMRLLRKVTPGISDVDLDTATLRTFGRKRKTKQHVAHLDRARSLI